MYKTKKRKTTKKKILTPEQKRNADIFRLRGFYANAKTLPFRKIGLDAILDAIDDALGDLNAETQTSYMRKDVSK